MYIVCVASHQQIQCSCCNSYITALFIKEPWLLGSYGNSYITTLFIKEPWLLGSYGNSYITALFIKEPWLLGSYLTLLLYLLRSLGYWVVMVI